jgi:hypothetical protein
MRKTLLALLASAVLLWLPSCGERAESPAANELGHKIAGTWLGNYEFEDAGSIRAGFITTYHPDGTGFTTSSRAWGAGDPERYGLSSTHHIQWEATGLRTIRWRLLHFGHEPDGSLRHVSRTHGVLEFDETFERGNGTFQVEVLAPEAVLDPLDPNNPAAEPLFRGEGRNEIKRLHLSEDDAGGSE